MAASSPTAEGGPSDAAEAPAAQAAATNGAADPKPLAMDSEAVDFRVKQNHWFPEPSKSDRDAWEGLDVLVSKLIRTTSLSFGPASLAAADSHACSLA